MSDAFTNAGGNDFLFGGKGANNLIAGAGNDKLFAKGNAGNVNTLSGNLGDDTAEVDGNALLAGIEATV